MAEDAEGLLRFARTPEERGSLKGMIETAKGIANGASFGPTMRAKEKAIKDALKSLETGKNDKGFLSEFYSNKSPALHAYATRMVRKWAAEYLDEAQVAVYDAKRVLQETQETLNANRDAFNGILQQINPAQASNAAAAPAQPEPKVELPTSRPEPQQPPRAVTPPLAAPFEQPVPPFVVIPPPPVAPEASTKSVSRPATPAAEQVPVAPAQLNRMSTAENRALIALGLAAFFLTPLSLLISIPLFLSYFNSKGKVPALTGIGLAAFFLTPLSLFFTIPYYESSFFKAHPPANAAQPKTNPSQAPFAGTSKGSGPRQQPSPARQPQSSARDARAKHALFASSAAAPKPGDPGSDQKAEAKDNQKPKPKK